MNYKPTYLDPKDIPEDAFWHFNHHRLGILCFETKQPLYGTMDSSKVKCQKCLDELQSMIDYEDEMVKQLKEENEKFRDLQSRFTDEMKILITSISKLKEELKHTEWNLKEICFHHFEEELEADDVCIICGKYKILDNLPF